MSAQPSSHINIDAITSRNLSSDALIPLYRRKFSLPREMIRGHPIGWRPGVAICKSKELFYCLLFLQPRTAPEIGYSLPHIWIAAVDPASRGQGIFALLMQRVVEHVRELKEKEITVCTYPARFKEMYRILQQTGWKEVAWRENGDKVLMKLDI
ncbi:hypothetical protein AC578_7918 [Pseudocercospora eumusae]|uniref:N-acetyltransferase domain-containing protein n=1 Tax=Pseudocercospora eumusae TaxID=321146 RepID=A0A139HPC6_9PEZI|nr:hypothetical protein AC578_7918 [Pseudocercospora eumusae]